MLYLTHDKPHHTWASKLLNVYTELEFTAWLIFDVAKPFEQLVYSVLSSGHSPDNLIFKETKFYEKPIYITTR